MSKIRLILFSIISIFIVVACTSESDEDQILIPEFDRSTILTNYAENIIIPRYADFKLSLMNLKDWIMKSFLKKAKFYLQGVQV